MSKSMDCNHQWDRGECRLCSSFAENLVFSYAKEIRKLEEKVEIAKENISFVRDRVNFMSEGEIQSLCVNALEKLEAQ